MFGRLEVFKLKKKKNSLTSRPAAYPSLLPSHLTSPIFFHLCRYRCL